MIKFMRLNLLKILMYISSRKLRPIMLGIFLVSFSFVLMEVTRKLSNLLSNRGPYILNWTFNQDISCHYASENDSLPEFDYVIPPPFNSIYFHETSCNGGLNSRKACSVESAARLHPKRNVYVFFNSPVSEYVLKKSCLAKLLEFENVKLVRIRSSEYAKGTVLEEMLARKENEQSIWKVEHTADILRFITLYKYGGVYLDTDVLVVKPLGALGSNWAAREDSDFVNVAALAADKAGVGNTIMEKILQEIKADYRPTEWVYNGPGAIGRVLLKFCNVSNILQLNVSVCHGFNIYPPETIYPVFWANMENYFRPGDLPPEMDSAYTHHMWNRVSRFRPIQKNSPYDKLAKKYCPSISEMFGDKFGS